MVVIYIGLILKINIHNGNMFKENKSIVSKLSNKLDFWLLVVKISPNFHFLVNKLQDLTLKSIVVVNLKKIISLLMIFLSTNLLEMSVK